MRKQMKLAAVVSTAALLALGASMTSMAAEKGTWKMDGNDWMCYDKNGDVYESTFCLSNGKEYYVGDDGYLVRSAWVDYDGAMYYVNSAGTKTINDWRLLTPYEDESADETWYYFGSKGKRATSDKVVVKDHTYYFDSEGKMLTGWVDTVNYDKASDYNSKVVYCNEAGARLSKEWIKTTAIGADEDSEDEFWYYIKSKGEVATAKQGDIKGQTYFFDNKGKMLTGWVQYDDDSADTVSKYISVQGEAYEDNTTKGLSSLHATKDKFYYCGDEDDGHMKRNKWIKLWNNSDADDKDYDDSQYWFYLESDGSVYLPADAPAADVQATVKRMELVDGEFHDKNDDASLASFRKINGKTYYFDANGQMITGMIIDDTAEVYYLGDDGAVKTGSQTIKDDNENDYKFYFATKDELGVDKGQGVTGNKSGKLYNAGKLVTAKDYKYELVYVNELDAYFIVNGSGSIQTNDNMYKEDNDKLVDGTYLHFSDGKYDFTGDSVADPEYKGAITEIDADLDGAGTTYDPFTSTDVADILENDHATRTVVHP